MSTGALPPESFPLFTRDKGRGEGRRVAKRNKETQGRKERE